MRDADDHWASDIEIRKDFKDIADFLATPIEYAKAFHNIYYRDWVQELKAFNEAEKIDHKLEQIGPIYNKSSQFALEMSYVLRSFNSVEDFPRFSSYVDYLEDHLHDWLSERPISAEIKSAVRDIIEKNLNDNSFFTLRHEDWRNHPISRQIQANVNDIVQKYISDPNYLGPHPTRWWSQHELEPEQLDGIVCSVAISIDFERSHRPSSPRDRVHIPHALDKMLPLAKKALYEHNINPHSISNLLKKQLEMTNGILGWVEDAKKTEKYQHEAGLPGKGIPAKTVSTAQITEPEQKIKRERGRPREYTNEKLTTMQAVFDKLSPNCKNDRETLVEVGKVFKKSPHSVRMALKQLRNKKLRN